MPDRIRLFLRECRLRPEFVTCRVVGPIVSVNMCMTNRIIGLELQTNRFINCVH